MHLGSQIIQVSIGYYGGAIFVVVHGRVEMLMAAPVQDAGGSFIRLNRSMGRERGQLCSFGSTSPSDLQAWRDR